MKTLLLLMALMPGISVFAQDDAAIQKWQLAHPTTLLISTARYASFTEEEKSLLGTDYILFEEKVTLELLQKFEAEKGVETTTAMKEKDKQFIKEWMATHSGVKIVPQSAFQAFAPERQQYCVDRPTEILVLEGEFLTLKDIENFGH